MPKKRRLTSALFTTVITKGTLVQGKDLYCRVFRIEGQKMSTFAVSVSKKIEKTAVGRNLIKRRIFNAIRDTNILLPTSLSVVIIAKKGIEMLPFTAIQNEVDLILKHSAALIEK